MNSQDNHSVQFTVYNHEIVYRVDHHPIPPGEQLRKYYVNKYREYIDPIQKGLEQGPDQLI